MKRLFTNLLPRVSRLNRKEIRIELLRQNYEKLKIISLLLFICESILYRLSSTYFGTCLAILPFLISGIILIPLIWIIALRGVEKNWILAKIVQDAYLLSVILLGCFLVLGVQTQIDLVHVYMITIFGVVFFTALFPLESFLMLASVFILFYFALPYYQPNAEIVLIVQVNALIFNLFAWLLGNLIFKMKLTLYFDKKLLKEQNTKLEGLAHKDGMTGLLNHLTALQKLEREIYYAKRTGEPLSLILMDIDDFKRINDRYGHQVGDHVIIKIAEIIRNTVRSADLIGRYGGEEFVIILPNTDLEAAKAVYLRIRQKLGEIERAQENNITMSCGISQYQGESIDDFIRVTDSKLYRAKNAGKDCFEC